MKYHVIVPVSGSYHADVEADNEEQALEMTMRMFDGKCMAGACVTDFSDDSFISVEPDERMEAFVEDSWEEE